MEPSTIVVLVLGLAVFALLVALLLGFGRGRQRVQESSVERSADDDHQVP